MKKKIAMAFTGPSNSGKTTIIKRVASYFIEKGLKVAVIKHDPKDKAKFDTPNKDSYNFFQTGADVAVVSPTRTTIFQHKTSTIEEIASCFGDYDILLVEGLKSLPLPRIGVFRGEIVEEYLPHIEAVAIDNTVKSLKSVKSRGLTILDLNSVEMVAEYIENSGKVLNGRDF